MTAPYYLRVTVPQPHLWNGRKDPYLYRAVVELRSADEMVDSVEQPLGLRYYSVDPDKGFFLNGQPYHLHGVDRHQDRMNKGWAITEADMDEDISLIKEIGARSSAARITSTAIIFTACATRPASWSGRKFRRSTKSHTPEFEETSRNQLLDLIRQNINHPSIFAWSLFNEIRDGSADPHRELQDLSNVANGEDPTRR